MKERKELTVQEAIDEAERFDLENAKEIFEWQMVDKPLTEKTEDELITVVHNYLNSERMAKARQQSDSAVHKLIAILLGKFISNQSPLTYLKPRAGRKKAEHQKEFFYFVYSKHNTVKATARFLDVSPKTVRNYISDDVREFAQSGGDISNIEEVANMFDRFGIEELESLYSNQEVHNKLKNFSFD